MLISKTVASTKAVWKTVLFVTPYIREKRGCAGGYSANPQFLPGGQYTANQVQPSRLISRWRFYIRGHPLLRRVCTSVTHGVAFQAITNNETC